MTSGKSTKIKSSHVRFGGRTYFFDVNQNSRGKYLKITQSKFLGEDKGREYSTFFLSTPEEIEGFAKSLTEAAVSLT